jgi:hypothetical protein
MFDLSSLIKGYRGHLYRTAGTSADGSSAPCPHYIGADQCSRKEGCFCRKLAEVKGNIDYIIPKEYRDLTIDSVSGKVVNKDGAIRFVWSEDNTIRIREQLRNYLFGNATQIMLSNGRESFNKYSQMDTRYTDGSNVVIHGDNIVEKTETKKAPRFLPAGKTMIACLLLKEAIWRRIYASNRAETYALVSFQTLKQDLRQRTEKASDLKECDWLCIDDINLPVNENDFNHQAIVTLFDDFLMTRIEEGLPTILVCSFDALRKDYTNSLGYTFQKIVSSQNSWLINVGGDE